MGRFDNVKYENPENITVYCNILLIYLFFNYIIDIVYPRNNGERLKKDLYSVFILLKKQPLNCGGPAFHS